MTSKDANSKPTGLLHSLPMPNRPWQSIGLDFMGPLPKSNNFDYLLVMIDQLTSQVHLVPTTMMVTARGIAVLEPRQRLWCLKLKHYNLDRL